MTYRRSAMIVSLVAVVAAACGGGTATTKPSTAGTPAASTGASQSAGASGGCSVAVSWNNFQQPRWAAHDKPNIQSTVEAGGGTYTDKDANLVTEQQLTDIDTMISQGADVLIILAQSP